MLFKRIKGLTFLAFNCREIFSTFFILTSNGLFRLNKSINLIDFVAERTVDESEFFITGRNLTSSLTVIEKFIFGSFFFIFFDFVVSYVSVSTGVPFVIFLTLVALVLFSGFKIFIYGQIDIAVSTKSICVIFVTTSTFNFFSGK